MDYIVLAYDVESSGDLRCAYGVFAIGCAVLDANGKLMEKEWWACMSPELYKGYQESREGVSNGLWEKRCWDEFWSKPEQRGVYDNTFKKSCTTNITQGQMIEHFIAFVCKWERYAKDNNLTLYRGCDNSPFDTHLINSLIEKYAPYSQTMTLPYKFSEHGRYSTHIDVHKIQQGFLMGYYVGSGMKDKALEMTTNQWGFKGALATLFKMPQCPATHDHQPDNDAYVIAYDMTCILHLCSGRI